MKHGIQRLGNRLGWIPVILGFALGASRVQALTYSWRPSASSYSAVAGTALSFSSTDNGTASVSLPFNFTYDSTVYSSLWASTNGLLGFGTGTTSSYNPDLYGPYSPLSLLAPWWDDLVDDATATVQTFTEGLSPNRVFVIQYGDYPDWLSGSTLRMQYQVRLYEGTNRIQFIYGGKNAGTPNISSSASIGIKGRNTLPGYFIEGTTGSRATGLSNLTSATGFPAAGTAFTFAPDTVAPVGLVALPGNGQADLTWRRSRLPTLIRYRVYVGASPTTMVLRDSTASLTDTILALTGLVNGTPYYVGVTGVGPDLVESGFAQVVAVTPTQLPSVSINSPATGTLHHNNMSISFTASASDPDGSVSRVEYYRGTTLIGSSTLGSTFALTWSFPVAGTHTVTAKAFDNTGASTTSAPITLTVNSAPTASLTAPAAGSLLAPGSTVTLTATATDGDGTVTVVEFLRGGVKIGEDSTSPYAFDWTATPSGIHTLTARAIDNSGGAATSTGRSVTVDLPPQVSITSPAPGTLVNPGTPLTFSAVATDDDGTVSRVEFYRGAVLIGSSYSGSPFNYTWSSVVAGTHVITARAFDNLGISTTSMSITLPVNTPPTVSLTAPAHFSAFPTSGSVALTASASDSTGAVAEVRFYRDSIFIGSSSSGPAYPVTWSNAAPGRYRLQARAVDEQGLIGYSQAVTVFVNDSAKAILGGRLVITGHDADSHGNLEFTSAGLDYLFFGKAAGTNDQPYRLGARIAFLGNRPSLQSAVQSYPQPVFIDLDLSNWDILAFPSQPYDVIIVGTGMDQVDASGSTSLNAQKAKFETYFNRGGGIFVMSEQGVGQTFYNFLPSFASARQQNIGDVSGVFTATPAGLAIGLTESIVDRDLTHTEFFDVDTTVFRIFESYNPDGQPVTIGASAIIEGDVFVPKDSVVADPQAFSRDTVFLDTLCIRFESPTPGAAIHLTRDGGNPDTSTWVIANGASVCIDNSATFRLVAKKAGWVRSNEKMFSYRRSDQVAVPVPNIPGSFFRDSLCVRFTSLPGSTVHYTLDGGRPDTSALSIPSGDSVCIDASAVIRVIGRKSGMRDSDTASHAYTRMLKVATPVADTADSTFFRNSLCFRLSSATPGADIHYTLDGGAPDTAKTHVNSGDSLCVDRTVTVRAIAEKSGWIPSLEAVYTYLLRPLVSRPIPSRPDSTRFRDSLCVRFTSATDSVTIHYLIGGGNPDTSSLTLAPGQDVCVDRTAIVSAVAKRPGWETSETVDVRYFRMDTVATPQADWPDSTHFAARLCVRLSTSTAGAVIHYTLDGGAPDTSAAFLANGDSICLEDTVTLRLQARKTDWIPSREAAFDYIRMQRVAKPVADKADSTYFSDSLCVRFSTATAGAALRYTVDGNAPDSTSPALAGDGLLCLDHSALIRVVGTRSRWIPSEETALNILKMDTVARPRPGHPDSTHFAGSLCVKWNIATSGALIRYTLDGGAPDTSARTLADGDTLCLDRTATVRAVGTRANSIKSPEAAATYIRMQQAAKPVADKANFLYFPDSLCIRWTSSTEGTRIHYTLDGGKADTSGLSIANGDSLCVDRSIQVRVAALLKNWIPSDEGVLSVQRMETVAAPQADRPDSTWFEKSLCVKWTTATAGAIIRLTGNPSDSSGRELASGDSVCLDRSATLKAVASLENWKNSAEVSRVYLKMDTVAKPVFDRGDTVFHPTVCARVSSGTPGAILQYTLDGGNPDTSALNKEGGDTICVDRSVEIRVIGKRKNSVPSEVSVLRLERMPQVAPLKPSIGDSVVFARRICFTLVSATDSVRIRYALDGRDPLESGLSAANGDSICLDSSAVFVAVGARPLWRNSEEVRISLEVDNEGPSILKAEKRPYNLHNISVSGNCRGIGQDTLVVTLNERLFPRSNPPRWDRLLLFSSTCESGSAYQVPVSGAPVLSKDGLEATLILNNNSQEESPKLGNCLSLDWKAGEFEDRVGNKPVRKGVRIEGHETAVRISQLRAYPPVVGLDDAKGASGGCLDEKVDVNTWIPPVGFDPAKGLIDGMEVRSCSQGNHPSETEGKRTAIPPCMAIVEVISDGGYLADIGIFDHLGNFVSASRQQFGACGELDNMDRSVAGKKRSYLVWNVRDSQGTRVGNGVYVWRIRFSAEKQGQRSAQTVLVRTGFIRNASCGD